MIRIVHLSDIHFNYERINENQIYVLEPLIEDLKKFHNEKKIDLICITGDLIDKGGLSFENDALLALEYFEEEFLRKIMSELSLTEEQIYFCPGNHDIERKKDSERINNLLFKELEDVEKTNDFIYNCINNEDNEGILRMKNFDIFENKFHEYHKNSQITKFESNYITNINNISIGISCFNSAWRCYNSEEKEKLLIGQAQISNSIKKIRNQKVKIALLHHSFEWLMEFDRDSVANHILREYDLLLLGHVHSGDIYSTTRRHGTIVVSVVPSSNVKNINSDSIKYRNGYSIIDYDNELNQITIWNRSYEKEANKYIDSNIEKDKKLNFIIPTNADKQRMKDEEEFVDKKIKGYFEEFNEHLLSYKTDSKAPKTINEIFVMPRILDRKDYENEKNENEYNLKQICKFKENILICGTKESGKSILIDKLMIEFSENYKFYNKVPIYIDLNRFHNSKIETYISNFFSMSILEIEEQINKKNIVLLIDNVNFKYENKGKIKAITNFRTKYPRVQIICTSNTQIQGENPFGLMGDLGFTEFKCLYIFTWRSKQIEPFIKKWFRDNTQNFNQVNVEDIVNIFENTKITCNPLSVSMFLWIIEHQENYKLINNGKLMECFFENLLEKLSINDIYSDTFDYRNKEQLLARIAHFMFQSESENCSVLYNDLYSFVNKYLQQRKFPYDSEQLIKYFNNKGILMETLIDNERWISFRFECFWRYFLMKHMTFDSKFREYVLQEKHYIDFENEIEYYTGVERNQEEILILVNKWMMNEYSEITEAIKKDNFNFDYFFETNKSLTNQINKDNLKKILSKGKISKESQNKLNDKRLDCIKEETAITKVNYKSIEEKCEDEEKRRNLDTLYRKWILTAKILKNTEETENGDLKNEIYLKVIKNSMIFCVIYKLIIDTVLENDNELEEEKENRLELSRRFIPIINQMTLEDNLSTKKLEVVFQEEVKRVFEHRQTISEFEKFLLIFIYNNTNTDNGIKYIKKFIKQIKRKYIKDTMLFKILYSLKFENNSADINSKYEDLLGDLIAKDEKHINKALRKQSFINNIRKEKLIDEVAATEFIE